MELAIHTPRLLIRSWRESDAEHYLELAKDLGYHNFSPPGFYAAKTKDEALEKIRPRLRLFEERGLGKFPVFLKETGEIIGTCGIEAYFVDGIEEREIGYRLNLAHWGQGYATEAARALMKYGLEELKIPRLIAFAAPQNVGSVAIIEKLGFRYWKMIEHNGVPHRCYEIG
jgi:[ribosomal protein S5]-alanine N-acetyltransferase